MSPDNDDERTARELQDEMEDEAGRMQKRLDEIGEQAADADKKADVAREHAEPEPIAALGDDQADEDGTDGDSEGTDDDSDGADDDSDDDADDDAKGDDDDRG